MYKNANCNISHLINWKKPTYTSIGLTLKGYADPHTYYIKNDLYQQIYIILFNKNKIKSRL